VVVHCLHADFAALIEAKKFRKDVIIPELIWLFRDNSGIVNYAELPIPSHDRAVSFKEGSPSFCEQNTVKF